jgi:murein DD-endopeptidase MepM/ murein hydrolase activator NlpD
MRKAQREKRKGAFSFIIVPHNLTKRMITFTLRDWSVYSSLAMLIFGIILVGSFSVYSALLTRKLINYEMMKSTVVQQQKEIDSFANQIEELKKSVSELSNKDNQLRKLLGISQRQDLPGSSAVAKQGTDSTELKNTLAQLNERIKTRKESLKELLSSIDSIKTRFAATPSVWPTRGNIVSWFGYRSYPWRGFHTGVDIDTWYGAPIRAAADGVVIHAGWGKNGFGRSVVIDHGYGLTSLYGHCSKLAIGIGTRVKKGQLIGFVGSTGLSTGPHLHFQVAKWDAPINPVRYLDLDIFSASRSWNK